MNLADRITRRASGALSRLLGRAPDPDGLIPIGRPLSPIASFARPKQGQPDWMQANEATIARALERARARSGGGWVAVDASRAIDTTPQTYRLAGRDWVIYRHQDEVLVAPDACPHMGADLGCARVDSHGQLVCPWHGLALDPRSGRGEWRGVPTHDDGVLVWAQVLPEEPRRQSGSVVSNTIPPFSARPRVFLDAVIRMEAACEPEDVVANRLDPWHGVHYHPHSFARLELLEESEDELRLRVGYRVFGDLVVDVACTFHAPTRRSIVMTIVDGDGRGSVVETHATPIDEGRSAVIEATLASSARAGFEHARRLAPLLRPLMAQRAARLWVEDVAYAERRYALRQETRRESRAGSSPERIRLAVERAK